MRRKVDMAAHPLHQLRPLRPQGQGHQEVCHLVFRHVPPCLEAGSWGQPPCRHLEGFSQEAASPCPGRCHPPSRYLFPGRQKAACLSDTSHHLSFRLCCSGCPWGSLMGFHTRCPQLLVSRVSSCQLQPLGFSHLPWQMPVDI